MRETEREGKEERERESDGEREGEGDRKMRIGRGNGVSLVVARPALDSRARVSSSLINRRV